MRFGFGNYSWNRTKGDIKLRNDVNSEEDFNHRSPWHSSLFRASLSSLATFRIISNVENLYLRYLTEKFPPTTFNVIHRGSAVAISINSFALWNTRILNFLLMRRPRCFENDVCRGREHRVSILPAFVRRGRRLYREYGRDQLARARNFYNVRHSRIALHILDTIELYYRELFVGAT